MRSIQPPAVARRSRRRETRWNHGGGQSGPGDTSGWGGGSNPSEVSTRRTPPHLSARRGSPRPQRHTAPARICGRWGASAASGKPAASRREAARPRSVLIGRCRAIQPPGPQVYHVSTLFPRTAPPGLGPAVADQSLSPGQDTAAPQVAERGGEANARTVSPAKVRPPIEHPADRAPGRSVIRPVAHHAERTISRLGNSPGPAIATVSQRGGALSGWQSAARGAVFPPRPSRRRGRGREQSASGPPR